MGTMSSITMQSLGENRRRLQVRKHGVYFDTFQNCHDVLYQRAKFWGRSNYARRCRSENWCFLYVTLCLPACAGHSSNKYCVTVYGSILMPFSAIFFRMVALSGALYGSHICRQMAPQFSRNCRQKLRKVQKSAEKFVRTTSYGCRI